MLEQGEQAEADRVPGRLVARRREEDEEDPELALVEPRAVHLGLDEPRRDVVLRLAAPSLAEPPPVLDQVEREGARERQHAELRVGERPLDDVLLADHLRVGVPEDPVAELDQQAPVLDGQAHDLREDPHRDLGGDRLHPVELVLLERLREDAAREPADPPLVGVDDPRREALVDDRAQPRVGRRIGVDHRLPRLDLLRRQILQRRPAELRRVRLPVLRDVPRCRRSA